MPLALELARLLRTLLYKVSPWDPLGVGVTAPCLALGGLLAAYVPARRATCIDPLRALRCE
jgi:putative ABC transport system permease protein